MYGVGTLGMGGMVWGMYVSGVRADLPPEPAHTQKARRIARYALLGPEIGAQHSGACIASGPHRSMR